MKNLFFLILIFIASISILNGCTKKVSNKKTTNALIMIPFIPPVDSTITVSQMQLWISCNNYLDSLTMHYIDSFKTDDVQARLKLQSNFLIDQDTVCMQAGLRGGHDEYQWISRNMCLGKNLAVCDSARIVKK